MYLNLITSGNQFQKIQNQYEEFIFKILFEAISFPVPNSVSSQDIIREIELLEDRWLIDRW